MHFSDEDLMIILIGLHILIPVSLGLVYAAYKVFRMRHLTFKLFSARDDLIRCVAIGAVKADAPIFKFFYKNVVSLIQAANTDFFTFRNFIERIHRFENDEMTKKQSKKIFEDLKLQKPEFQEAVSKMIVASQEIMLERNFLLWVLVKVVLGSLHLQKYAKNISTQYKTLVGKKSNYEEYKFLEDMKTNLSLQY